MRHRTRSGSQCTWRAACVAGVGSSSDDCSARRASEIVHSLGDIPERPAPGEREMPSVRLGRCASESAGGGVVDSGAA